MHRNLANHIPQWKDIAASEFVINTIAQGVQFPIAPDIQSCIFKNKSFSVKEEQFLTSELEKLLLLGCIEKCEEVPFCVSPIFMCPQKRRKF